MSAADRHRLLVATGNAGKVREFAELFRPVGWECLSLADLTKETGTALAEPEENGRTFRANACIKATEYARLSGCWTLADDSGLEVDALGGGPGVYSARWAERHGIAAETPGREARDQANNRLLLQQLAAIPDGRRGARFVCVLALADPAGRIVITTRGVVEGEILHAPRGEGGFGYDPLFLIRDMGRTTAELSSDDKHRISHRGAATRSMVRLMRESRLSFAAVAQGAAERTGGGQ